MSEPKNPDPSYHQPRIKASDFGTPTPPSAMEEAEWLRRELLALLNGDPETPSEDRPRSSACVSGEHKYCANSDCACWCHASPDPHDV